MSEKAKSILIPLLGISAFYALFYVLYNHGHNKNKKSEPNTNNNGTGGSRKNVLFIGDSLTAAFGIDGKGFVDQLRQQRPDLNINRIAVTGKQTGWMLEQLKKELATGAKYDIIGIWGGINDIYATNSINVAKKNLQEMYDLAHKAGARVIALNTIPSGAYKMATPKKIKLTNDLNAWIASTTSKDSMLDVNSLVGDGYGKTKTEYMQPDKLHLTEGAQKKIASKLQDLL